MKILIVLDRYYPIGGGIQQYIRGLARQLSIEGHNITILTQTVDGQPERETLEEGMIVRTPVLADVLPQPEFMLERWPQLLPYLKEFHPDVVYANNHTSIGTIKACQEMQIPVVYGCHGWGLLCTLRIRLLRPDESLCYNERSLETCRRCNDRITSPTPPRIHGRCRGLFRTTWRRLRWQQDRRQQLQLRVDRYDQFQNILESANARIGISKLTASLFNSANTFSVYYGIDAELYKPTSNHEFLKKYSIDESYLILSGRLHPTKGHEWAIRALRQLPEDLKLVIAGSRKPFTGNTDSADPYVEKLQKLISDLGLKDRVIFTGQLSSEELAQGYSGALATLVPSVWLEAFGYITAEAMACGCPVIITSNCGSAELVREGVDGYIIERMNSQALAHAVIKTLPHRSDMGRAAREHIVEELNWPKIAGEVLHILDTVTKQ